MRNPINRLLILGLLLLTILLSFKNCEMQKEYGDFRDKAVEKFEENNAELYDAEQRVYRGDVIIQEQNKRIQRLIDTIEHISKPKIITRIVTVTKLDTVYVPFEKPTTSTHDGRKWLAIPLKFNKVDKWYSIAGSVKETGIHFDSLTYTNDLLITTGREDHGSRWKNFIRRNNTVIQVKDNNPYSATKTLHQTVIKERKRKIHIGPSVGYMFFPQSGYYIGVGVNYSLISF